MPFDRPSLSELRAQTATDINAALPGVDALLRYSNLGILAEVLAALASGHYGYADWIALQSVPFTATDEYLEGWASLKGIIRKPATFASGQVSFVATAGARIPAGTTINRSDGVAYATVAEVVAAEGVAVAGVAASTSGASGNAAAGTAMTLGLGISGVTASGSAATALTGGVDIESDADLRSRMLAAYATPPQGGSITDYPNWARAVPGITRAWVKPGVRGPGTVTVLFMMDQARAAQGGFPQGTNGVSSYETRDTAASGDQLAVANAIFPKQPVTALVYAEAPIGNLLTITIDGLSGVGAATQDAIFAAIRATLLAEAAPGATISLSLIEAAVASVPGTSGFVITHINASEGAADHGGVGNVTSNPTALPWLFQIVYA